MSSPSANEHREDDLLKHLDGLFSLAQFVTSDAEEAVDLVEAVFSRAYASQPEFSSEHERRVWLFQILMEVHRDRKSPAAPDEVDARPAGGPIPDLSDFRRRLTEQFVDRVLPLAFATLSPPHRLILILCDVQRLSCEDAARVLDLSVEAACGRLDEARIELHRAVEANAADAERRLLETGLAQDWKRAGLQRMVEAEAVSPPPTLRPAILAAAHRGGGQPLEPSPLASDSGGDRTSAKHVVKRVLATVIIIAVAGTLGYGFSYMMRRTPDLNLISISASQAVDVEASFQTESPEQAERYVYDRLGLRVTVPTITRAALQGVSIRSVAEGAEVPALVYRNGETSGTVVVVYVYSYAFLDRNRRRLILDEGILRQIEEEGNFDLHDLGEEKALVWRKRDDILVAITSGDADELRRRIRYPS